MSSWRPVLAGVLQRPVMISLPFLIYINDLSNELKSHAKLSLISKWTYDWKMLFNTDPSKTAQEVLFSRKRQVQTHPVLIMNNIQVERVPYQEHLAITLSDKLDFKQHIDKTISKVNNGISTIRKLFSYH